MGGSTYKVWSKFSFGLYYSNMILLYIKLKLNFTDFIRNRSSYKRMVQDTKYRSYEYVELSFETVFNMLNI